MDMGLMVFPGHFVVLLILPGSPQVTSLGNSNLFWISHWERPAQRVSLCVTFESIPICTTSGKQLQGQQAVVETYLPTGAEGATWPSSYQGNRVWNKQLYHLSFIYPTCCKQFLCKMISLLICVEGKTTCIATLCIHSDLLCSFIQKNLWDQYHRKVATDIHSPWS